MKITAVMRILEFDPACLFQEDERIFIKVIDMNSELENGQSAAGNQTGSALQSIAGVQVSSAMSGQIADRIWCVSSTLELVSGNAAFHHYLEGTDFNSGHLQEAITVLIEGQLQTITWTDLYKKALLGQDLLLQIIGTTEGGESVATDSVCMSPLKDGNGNITSVACVGKYRMEADDETDIIKVLANATNVGVEAAYIWKKFDNATPEYQIIYANPPFEKLTGYTVEEALGKSPAFTLGSQLTPEFREELLGYASAGQLYHNDLKQERKDGSVYWANALTIPIRSRNGSIALWVSILRDITASKAETIVYHLSSDIGRLFAQNLPLHLLLEQTLQEMSKALGIQMAEVWMTNYDKQHMDLKASFSQSEQFDEVIKLGLEKGKVNVRNYWPNIQNGEGAAICWYTDQAKTPEVISRGRAFKKAGLALVCIYPLVFGDQIVGSLVLGSSQKDALWISAEKQFDELMSSLARELSRKRQELQLKALIDTIPDYIAVTSFDGHFVMVNPAASRITGYTEEELTTIPFKDIIHPDDWEATQEVVKQLSEDKVVVKFENRQITKDGRSVWLEWNAFLLKEENLMMAVARDVTELKSMQRILSHASHLAQMGAWELDPANMSSINSEVASSILGLGQSNLFTHEDRVALFSKTESGRQYLKQLDECVSKGTPVNVVVHTQMKDGNWRWMRIKTEAEMLGGKCVRVYGSVLDITAQKEAELNLLKANQRFELVAEATQDAIWDWEVGNENVYRGRGYATLFGDDLSEPYTFDLWLSRIHEEDRPSVLAQVEEVMNDKNCHIYKNNYRYRRANGNYAYISDSIRILRDKDGKAIRMVGAISDLTDFKKYEESLQQLNNQLQLRTEELVEKNKDLEQFAYAASHDLQEPLRTVSRFLGMIELKYKDQLDDKGKQYIQFAVDGARRMDKMIAHLLEYSRAGNSTGDVSQVDLNEVLSNVLRSLQAQLNENKAVIAADVLPTVMGVEAQWHQVFQNLLTNAIKYRKADVLPTVHVYCHNEGNEWHLQFADNGIGIDKINQERVFVIFQRLHTQEEIPGSGIGLAITKKMVQRMGGRIWVESQPGKGSVFHITVPKNGVAAETSAKE